MVTDEQDRIRLCEWQGWKRRPPELLEPYPNGEPRFGPELWDAPDGSAYGVTVGDLPDPKHDPADCEALIRHLTGMGWQVEIFINAHAQCVNFVNVKDSQDQIQTGFCDDWKHGIVELALKVKDGEESAHD